MYEAIARFSIGIVILLVSSFVFIEAGKKVSSIFKISNLVIGITLIAFGTSLPELAVSTASVLAGDIKLAVANIVGSNIVNILLIFPIGILMGHLRVGTEKTQRNLVILFFASLLFLVLPFLSIPAYLKGSILFAGAILVTIIEYHWGITGRTHEDRKHFAKSKITPVGIFDLILLGLSLMGIIYGGITTASTSQTISIISGYSTTVIGLTLTAICTSLPELFFTIIGQSKNEEKLTLGNILGSNLYNLLFIGGIIYFLSDKIFTFSYIELIFLPLATIIFMAATHAYKGAVIPRRISILFLIIFFLYSRLLGLQ